MKELLLKLKALPGKLLDLISSLIDGIAKQMSTAKGAVLFIVGILLVIDVLSGGAVGVIKFSIGQLTIILNAITAVLKAGGWQLIILALILVLLKK